MTIVSQTITEYCNEIQQLREALNNAICAGDILRVDLPADELITEKQKLAVILLENARQILDRG